jgi:hypothetical protein
VQGRLIVAGQKELGEDQHPGPRRGGGPKAGTDSHECRFRLTGGRGPLIERKFHLLSFLELILRLRVI